jgi:polar amino acid transport system ATP-binding protein
MTEESKRVGEPLVVARGVRKSYGAAPVLRGIDLELLPGEVLSIIGPSGAGKSTFLRCINHLERIDGGELVVNGAEVGYRRVGHKLYELRSRELARTRSRIGMVFQHFNLFPHLTAIQNVIEAPVHVRHVKKDAAMRRGMELLDRVGLAEKASSFPGQLSGGQQQRVAIARALAMDPTLLLFDEPTSALDPELVSEVLGVMRELAAEGRTMIVVTHEFAFARQTSDRVAVMIDGRVVEEGAARSVFESPRDARTQSFLSKALSMH